MKDLEWLKAMQLEIQEHEEGKWIEIHLSETVDDKDEENIGLKIHRTIKIGIENYLDKSKSEKIKLEYTEKAVMVKFS